MKKLNKTTATLLGVALGDALGVPYEFKSHEEMIENPANDMVGYGTYNLPEGTWSDDSSLTFCLAESLTNGYDLADQAKNFIAWRDENYWTPRGHVFDIGMTTTQAISRLKEILNSNDNEELNRQKYYGDEYDNGNGSLMRIIPLLFYIKGRPIEKQFEIIWEVAALTHRHIRGAMCCLIYLRLAEHLLNGKEKEAAYFSMQKEVLAFWQSMEFSQNEQKLFIRLMERDVRDMKYRELRSGGYVMESIESSIWCFLQRDSFEEITLAAVNLGHDTDTTAAIAGGLAGLFYGIEGVPKHWINSLARKEDIIDLGNRLHEKYS